MGIKIRLCDLADGQCASITDINNTCAIRERLRDLGFASGACVKALYGRGGLRAYSICGAVIALRKEDARYVEVRV